MKARIEKKLSKRLTEIAPLLCKGWWVDDEISELAYQQGTSINHVRSVGGEFDSFLGEASDHYTAWGWWRGAWHWCDVFEPYPEGHKHECYPNTEGFQPTTRNLLRLAVEANAKAAAALAKRQLLRKRLLGGGE